MTKYHPLPSERGDIPENGSVRVTFKNPEEAEIGDAAYRHERQYYEAVHNIRHSLGGDINNVVGEWLVAVEAAHYDNDLEQTMDMFEDLIRGYTDKEIEITLKENDE